MSVSDIVWREHGASRQDWAGRECCRMSQVAGLVSSSSSVGAGAGWVMVGDWETNRLK